MFFETLSNTAFAGYADDNTPYTYSSNMQLNNVQKAIEKQFQWFRAIVLQQILKNVTYWLVLKQQQIFIYQMP